MGIDQSYTNTGYCVIDERGDLIDFGTYKTSKDHDVYDRALSVANFVISKIDEHNLDGFTIEGLALGMRGDATRDLAGLIFTIIIQTRLHKKNALLETVAPTSLKKFATGSGKATKDQMITSVPQHILDEFLDAKYKKTTGLADVCDAYWLARKRLDDTK